jgi:serine/threonine protein kinase
MADSAKTLEPGTLFAERYEVVEEIGRGGMGVVYLARDSNTGEQIVLKLIHPDLVSGEAAVKRLMAEGLTARQIRHPNIVAVYDVATWDGQPYFTMEYVKGGSLRRWISKAQSGKETSLATAAGIVKSMLAGLAEAHRMGVVHRDLKPENILLSGDPEQGDFGLKILDFGIAKAVSAPATNRASGSLVGTPDYMAPEQRTAAEAVGPAADLYSLTVVFYELLMDNPPVGRWEPVTKSRPDIPKSIDDLIDKGLSLRPRNRFQSVAEYTAALDAALAHAAPSPAAVGGDGQNPLERRKASIETPPADVRPPAPPPAPIPPAPPPSPSPVPAPATQTTRWKLWAGIAAAVVVLGIIGNLIDNGDGTLPPPPPEESSYAGFWVDATGTRFDVEVDGRTFSATSPTVTLTGEIDGTAVRFTSTETNGRVLNGTGTIYTSTAGQPHLSYRLSNGWQSDFAINHSHR